MTKFLSDLEQETINLERRYEAEIQRGMRLLQEGLDRPNASTHLGHNLASIASELSVLAGKIEHNVMIFNDLKARLARGEN